MPSRRDVLDRNQRALLTAEQRAARAVARAYNQARRELLDALLQAWTGSDVLDPADALNLLRRSGILQRIDQRLQQLEQEVGIQLRDVINASSELALEQVRREMALLPREIRAQLTPFVQVDTAMVERFVPIAMEDVTLGTAALRSRLRRELQTGLLQGESFPALTRRLFTSDVPSVWRNGLVSAERLTRRLVIHANNAAHLELVQQAAQDVPELRKQAVAAVGPNTTETCLHVHGQIRELSEPFDLAPYEPRFADRMQQTPFHWNCRTAITAWHPVFERSGLTTANMRRQAEAELRRRNQ